MHKIFLSSLIFASASAFALGACTSPEKESCESFKETRDACEAMNGVDEDDPEPANFDLCNNVDVECKEFYECAVLQECKEVGGVFRLDYSKTCTMPEDKECTDADLRP